MDLPEKAIREQVASAIDIIIQFVRYPDGTRKVVKLSEMVGMEGSTLVMQDFFVFDQKGIDKDGNVVGEFKSTGIRPKFVERFKLAGFDLPAGFFEE